MILSGCGTGTGTAGASSSRSSSAASASRAATRAADVHPVNANAGKARTAGATPVQKFRSRPDLLPPRVTMAKRAQAGPGEPLIFTESHGGSGQQGPLVVDRSGELVFFLPVSDNGTTARRAFNVGVQSYLGQPVLAWFEG
ncbi:MAG: hypothetical protein ACRDMJ_16780, partial [Solirubrobacteraceae bacterium]